ncbi:MAG: LamG-like jellyroll fold domain-containing protein [Flavobacteriales bacterium]
MSKKFTLLLFLICITLFAAAQSIGDTITVQSFDYNSSTRDTMVSFPTNTSIKYEKILMLYNMRCKNGLVSTGSQRNLGCGEWDYSCNTYLHDSTRRDSLFEPKPKYQVTGITPTVGNVFHYKTSPVYDYRIFTQKNVVVTGTTSESKDTIAIGNDTLGTVFDNSNLSGKSLFLYTASELSSSGFSAGTIDAIEIDALTPGNCRFLRVKVKHDTSTQLKSNSPVTTGFTEVYFSDYSFSVGTNRIQFHTPFVWNGTSNLIFEFSFTNSITSSTNIKLKAETVANKSLNSANGSYLSLGDVNHYKIISTALAGIQNEITISFWSKGNPGTHSTNTSILEANNSRGSRELNIHHPWSNGSIYFDCGTANGSGYDRINKASSASVTENTWNHWAFTKNATTGEMKIFLNGTQWQSGTGKTKSISFNELLIGRNINEKYIYYGMIDELRIWDKALSQTTIENWMNIPLNSTHPHYSNLIGYYPVEAQSTNQLTDYSSNSAHGKGMGIDSSRQFVRGVLLDKFFNSSSKRPTIALIQGVYTLSITNLTKTDSIRKAPLSLTEHTVVTHPNSIISDEYNPVNAQLIYSSDSSIVYFESTDSILSKIAVSTTDSVIFSNLDYHRRFPMKFEIMSFVTPYGIGLNLGPNGKTWVFDVTDFSPFLTGNKRITMERGGQWQEEMDISFQFIVGTPEREVLDIQEIWPVSHPNYTDIISEKVFPPRKIPLLDSGKYFEVTTSITGHGQEGEFIPRNHFFKVGASKQFQWQVWKDCGENPVYPQGGTWIYDRAGWCPGMPTDIRRNSVTDFVTAGDSGLFDYGITTATGTSRYFVSNKLITYGEYNHNLDAAIVDIVSPSKRVEYQRENDICHYPKITIRNAGKDTLRFLKIEFWVNNNSTKETFNWTGKLAPSTQEVVEMFAPASMWNSISGPDNVFNVEISNPNNGTDEYSYNNKYSTEFKVPIVVPSSFVLHYRSNSAANETSFKIYDEFGNVIHTNSGQANNTLVSKTFNLGLGCYRLEVTDTDGDGIGFWANSDGAGYMRLQRNPGPVIYNVQPDFGASFTLDFTVGSPLAIANQTALNTVKLYPNPTSGSFTIEGNELENVKVTLINSLGQEIDIETQYGQNQIKITNYELASGVYSVIIQNGEAKTIKKLIIQ